MQTSVTLGSQTYTKFMKKLPTCYA